MGDSVRTSCKSSSKDAEVPRMQLNISSVYLEGSAQYTIGIRTSPPVMPMVVMPLPPLPPIPCPTAPYPSLPFTYSSGLGPRAISMEVNSMNRIQYVGPIRATSLPHAPRPRAPSIWKEMMGESGPLGVVNERGIRVPHSKSSLANSSSEIHPNECRRGPMCAGCRGGSVWSQPD